MATTFVDVLLQLRDNLGAATLSGGKIYTYEAGTSTPLATYTDLAGATANANPVILDSAGMAVIRQTDGVAYKWVVDDSADNLLWTRDNITVGTSAAAATVDYLVHCSFQGAPTGSQFMTGHEFTEDITFPIDFSGSVGSVQTNPGAEFIVSVEKNGSEIGTVTISTGGVFAFDTTSHVAVSYSSGDTLVFRGPAVVGTAADFAISLVGTID